MVVTIGASLLAAPPVSAAQPTSAYTDGPISVLVLRTPVGADWGKVRMSWDLTTPIDWLGECGRQGLLQYKAVIVVVEEGGYRDIFESEEFNTLTGSVEVELPEGNFIALLDPYQCTDENSTISGNPWLVQFSLAKCKPEGGNKFAVPTSIRGSATMRLEDGSTAPLTMDSQVPMGAQITTKNGTIVELRTCDGSAVRVGPAAKFTLKEIFFGSPGEKKFSAKLFFGQIWTVVSGVMAEPWYDVETESYANGVRGTTYCLRVTRKQGKETELLQVVDGIVRVTSKATGRFVDVTAGNYLKLVGPNAPLKPKPMAPGSEPTAQTCV